MLRDQIHVFRLAFLLVLFPTLVFADVPLSLCNHAIEVTATTQGSATPPPKEREIRTAYKLLRPHLPAFEPFRIAVVDDDDKTPGSTVCVGTGQPIIVVHQLFIDLVRESQVGSDDYWKWLFFISHEHAHITLGHATREKELSCETPAGAVVRAEAEKAADYWAGFVLGKLGAGREDSTAALKAIAQTPYLNREGKCYPPMAKRLQNVTSGWEQAGIGVQFGKDALEKFIVADNRDFNGNNFYSEPANTVEMCAAACARRFDKLVQCKGFSYDKRYHVCFLKGHFVNDHGKVLQKPFSSEDALLWFDPYSIVGVAKDGEQAALPSMIPLKPAQTKECDRFCTEDKTKGNALFGSAKDVIAATLKSCLNKCRSDLTCLAAQWKPSSRGCRFYSTITGWHHDADAAAVIMTRKYQPDPLCKGGGPNLSCNQRETE